MIATHLNRNIGLLNMILSISLLTINLTSQAAAFEQNALEDSLLGTLRERTTSRKEFQEAAQQLTHALVFKTAQHLEYHNISINTPLAPCTSKALQKLPILVPILRSGLILLPGFLNYFKGAPVGFLGLKRDETTAIASLYYANLPSIEADDYIIVLEPMLATGGTLTQVLALLKNAGAQENQIIVASIVCTPEGVERLKEQYPGISIVSCAQDEGLNERSYIVPGLGDFGDRFFGTNND